MTFEDFLYLVRLYKDGDLREENRMILNVVVPIGAIIQAVAISEDGPWEGREKYHQLRQIYETIY